MMDQVAEICISGVIARDIVDAYFCGQWQVMQEKTQDDQLLTGAILGQAFRNGWIQALQVRAEMQLAQCERIARCSGEGNRAQQSRLEAYSPCAANRIKPIRVMLWTDQDHFLYSTNRTIVRLYLKAERISATRSCGC